MRIGIGWVAAAVVLAAACGDDAEAPVPPPPSGTTATEGSATEAAIPEGPAFPFDVQDVTVSHAVRALAEVSDIPVVIDPNAQVVADCARITVASPSPRPAGEILDLIGAALASSQITLERTPQGVVLHRERAAPLPDTCRPQPVVAAADPLGAALGGTGGQGSRPSDEALEAFRDSVLARSDTEYLLTQDAVDTLRDQQQLARSARIIPDMENGEVVGMKLYGIRRNSVLAVLGLRNGDSVRSVGGLDISSPEGALEAYARLRGRNQVTVVVDRRGERVELRYRVVDRLPRH